MTYTLLGKRHNSHDWLVIATFVDRETLEDKDIKELLKEFRCAYLLEFAGKVK